MFILIDQAFPKNGLGSQGWALVSLQRTRPEPGQTLVVRANAHHDRTSSATPLV